MGVSHLTRSCLRCKKLFRYAFEAYPEVLKYRDDPCIRSKLHGMFMYYCSQECVGTFKCVLCGDLLFSNRIYIGEDTCGGMKCKRRRRDILRDIFIAQGVVKNAVFSLIVISALENEEPFVDSPVSMTLNLNPYTTNWLRECVLKSGMILNSSYIARMDSQYEGVAR